MNPYFTNIPNPPTNPNPSIYMNPIYSSKIQKSTSHSEFTILSHPISPPLTSKKTVSQTVKTPPPHSSKPPTPLASFFSIPYHSLQLSNQINFFNPRAKSNCNFTKNRRTSGRTDGWINEQTNHTLHFHYQLHLKNHTYIHTYIHKHLNAMLQTNN